jgi:DNA-binding NtrC family response regulator
MIPMEKPRIVLVDDNESFLDLFCFLPDAGDYEIFPFASAEKALNLLNMETVDLVISDVEMPGMSGIEFFKRVQDMYPDIPFILLTAYGSTEKAVQAVKKGAYHYFEKPIDDKLEIFWITVRNALHNGKMRRQLASLQKEKSLRSETFLPIIGNSSGIKDVLQSIQEVADLPVTVLITGETGTGKELVAQAIHKQSKRNDKPFFAINCSELSSGILESELFGHEKGAFTGAINQKKGLFEITHQGTLFLDEIGEAPVSLQAKLLRVIENKSFKRVGGESILSSDFRIITATNSNLESEIAEGRFRKDLFYRLNVYTIQIPSLRDRREDIPPIADFYVKKFSLKYNKPAEALSENALLALRNYDWPGNVRELINVIERAVITCKTSIITTEQLPFVTKDSYRISDLNLKSMERFFVELAIRRTGNNKTKAAELLGISRKTLIEKVKNYGF